MLGRAGSGPAGVPRLRAQTIGVAGTSPFRPGLIGTTTAYGDVFGSSPGIDTTGANLLVLNISWFIQSDSTTPPTFSDSYGNTWTQLGTAISDGQGGASIQAVYYVNSQTPSVGPGHAVSFNGTPKDFYAVFQLSAWRSTVTWAVDQVSSHNGTLPHSSRPAVTATNRLVISGASCDSNDSLSDTHLPLSDWTTLDLDVRAATNFSAASAYFTSSGTSADSLWWTASGSINSVFAAYHIYSFTGGWTDTGTGLAQGQGTATGTGPVGFGSGSAAGVGAAAGIALVPPNLVISFTPGGDRNDFTGRVGVRFTAGSGQTYNSIGLRMGTANTGLHSVALYDSGGTQLRQANVNLSGGTVGTFYYASLSSPITLTNGATYWLATDTTAGDGQYWSNEGPTTLAFGVTNVGAAYWNGSWNTDHLDEQFVGVDLTYVSATDTGAGAASGNGLAAATGRSDSSAATASSGIGAAAATAAIDIRAAGVGAGVGSSTVGARSDARSAGISAGLGAAIAASAAVAAGIAAGHGSAAAVGFVTGLDVLGVGLVAGTSTATAVGIASASVGGRAAGTSAAAGIASAAVYSIGFISGIGSAVGYSARFAEITKVVDLSGAVSAPPSLTGKRSSISLKGRRSSTRLTGNTGA
jgi:Domain of unknown function (DUF4082)